jgi:hypothetical protein
MQVEKEDFLPMSKLGIARPIIYNVDKRNINENKNADRI